MPNQDYQQIDLDKFFRINTKIILRNQCTRLQRRKSEIVSDANTIKTTTTTKDTTTKKENCSNGSINYRNVMSRRTSHRSLSSSSYSITSLHEDANKGDYYETTSYSEYRNISITLRNIPEHIKVEVHVHPVDMDNVWLSRIYRSYENDLWHKSPREPKSCKKKWYYNCLLCHKPLMAFESLKYHLNRHLDLYPFVCKVCGRPHTSRSKAVKHLRKVHFIVKDYKYFIGN